MFGFFRKDANREVIETVFARMAEAARQPELFSALGIPDTVNGRIESLSLHLVVLLRALIRLPAPADEIAKDLTDYFYEQIEGAMREIGVADIKVPKRMKRMAGALLGRSHVVAQALQSADRDGLAMILCRDVLELGDVPNEAAMRLAEYLLEAEKSLSHGTLNNIISGAIMFPRAGAF